MDPARTALLIVDLQKTISCIRERGLCTRAALRKRGYRGLWPARIKPLAEALRAKGGCTISTHFTLVPGRGGEPIISPHLLQIRPFLRKGDFSPGSWGHAQVDSLGPADMAVEKIAYSAFYMTRLEWLLRKCGIDRLIAGGIVTNGGVASTVRDAHVRDIEITVLEDGCAAFSRELHDVSIAALRPVAEIATIEEVIRRL